MEEVRRIDKDLLRSPKPALRPSSRQNGRGRFVAMRGRGKPASTRDVDLYINTGERFPEIRRRTGNAVVLIHGVHSVRVIDDFQAMSIKQGPFLGPQNDNVEVTA